MPVAVVTGGSSGIGAATARALTSRGWRCVLLARSAERLERAAAEIGAEAEVCDVADRTEVEAVAARIGERHPAVQLLVNNAGFTGRRGFLELEPEAIDQIARTVYLGSVWCLRAFLPLLEAGRPADLVNVVSVAGTFAHGASGPYAAAKHAQLAFSRSVTTELAPRGVRVHTVNPGPVETAGFPQRQLLGHRLGSRLVLQPDQVAEAIVRAVERDRAEVILPRYLRLAGALQALAPAALARLATRARGRA
ncbi:MAG TPA: SDR family oxidoreductase [Gaiellaceae bacterium]|nr:SDR family oxidoreductase [Gaiellaceae bacterium]